MPASGEPTLLPARGTLLGIWPDIRLDTSDVTLAHGDGIILCTDGVSDPGPGPERVPVQALVSRPEGADADQLAEAMQAYAAQAPGPQRDDIAILALRLRDPEAGYRGDGSRELALSAPAARASAV